MENFISNVIDIPKSSIEIREDVFNLVDDLSYNKPNLLHLGTKMTRINIVEPHQLTKQHLLAEYRELPRVFTHILKAVDAGKKLDDFSIPEKYTIGKGHVTFFYNKCRYLIVRWESIVTLLEKEGYNLDKDFYTKVISSFRGVPTEFKGSYEPTPEEIYLNMYRLSNRFFFKLDNDVNDFLVLDKMRTILI